MLQSALRFGDNEGLEMKKLIIILLLVFLPLALFAETSAPYEHYMLGYVRTVVDFSVTILEDVLPFDLEGADVAFNDLYVSGDSGQIKGLRIGEYTLVSNSNEFELYISHTPLARSLRRGFDADFGVDLILRPRTTRWRYLPCR